jgi:hypothetical protein
VRFSAGFIALVIAIAASLAAVQAASAAGPAQLAFAPASATGPVGSTLNVDITVANVDPTPGLGGYSITLTFDPAIVHIASLQDSGFITSGQNIVICSTGALDNTAGTATAGCTAIPLFGAPGVSTAAPVALLHASFSGVAPGTSALSLAGSTLTAPDGTAIAAAATGGSVTVSSGGPSAPSVTAGPGSVSASATASTTAQPSATAAAAETVTPAASVSASPAEQAAGTVLAGALKPPATGSGGRASGHWPLVALAVLAAAGALALTGAIARQHWKTHD